MPNEIIALTEAVFYILLALDTPLHGYGIMQKAEEMTGGRVHLAAGTLYGALNSMLEKGWIHALPGEITSRRKQYKITASGRDAAKNELSRLRELVSNGEAVLEGKV